MAEGYNQKGTPDPSWWSDQIQAGEHFRRFFAHEDLWPVWRDYYRGNWDKRQLAVSIFFSMLRQLVPRVYFRNPAVSVTPAKPGFLNIAFAQVVNRIDNKMIRQMDLKSAAKDMVQNAFLFGTAFGKLGWGAQYTPSPTGLGTSAPTRKRGDALEYHSHVEENMPWYQSIHPRDVVLPIGLRNIRESRWIAHRVTRPRDDVENDPRFKVEGKLPALEIRATQGLGIQIQTLVEMVEMYEIRDRQTRRVFVIAPNTSGSSQLLLESDDLLSDSDGFNIFPVIFNEDDEVFWGIPDSRHLDPLQREMNELRTQQMKHRRVAVVKLLCVRKRRRRWSVRM